MKSFTLVHQDEQSKARVGILHTSHSDIPVSYTHLDVYKRHPQGHQYIKGKKLL